MFEIHDVTFEIYIDNQMTQSQRMQAPQEMIIMNFVRLAKQMKDDPRPIRVKLIRPVVIWDPFEQKQKILNNMIELSNKE